MLRKCANPACPNLFRHLSQGKLFQVERGFQRTDFTTSGAKQENPVSTSGGTLLDVRRVLFVAHSDLRKGTGNGHSSATRRNEK